MEESAEVFKSCWFEPDEEGYKALMTDKPDNFLYLNAALSNKNHL